MSLMTKELKITIPPLYSRETVKDPMVVCKFFLPTINWTWYVTEFDGDDVFYGFVVAQYKELGYFKLSELEYLNGLYGCDVERDVNFEPQKLSEVMRLHNHTL